MISKKKKLNKLKVKRCIIIIVLILLIIILLAVKISKKNNRYKDLTVLMNNEFINLSQEIIIDENNNIFFSKDDIQNIFDKYIYFNEAEKELITTHNTHIAVLKIDEENAQIDDETVKLSGKLKQVNKQIYLPITDLQKVYNIELEYSKNSNRIIIDSTENKKVEATISKRTKVKSRRGLFSKKIDKLIIGEKVIVLGEEKNYKKIRTPLGNIGYIKKNIISNEKVIREKEEIKKQELVVYKNYSNISGIYDNIQVDETKLNVVIPTFFYLEKENKVLDRTTSTTATYSIYKTWTDTNKLTILPTFTNDENVSNSLLSYTQRSAVINALKNQLINYNYIGINIKFDSIDEINSFYRFVLELVPRFKAANLKVAVTLNDKIDKSRLEGTVDYFIEK